MMRMMIVMIMLITMIINIIKSINIIVNIFSIININNISKIMIMLNSALHYLISDVNATPCTNGSTECSGIANSVGDLAATPKCKCAVYAPMSTTTCSATGRVYT
ncbi:hypothetical protein DPMN_146908 [Dreissena polymorpha]|uniref:Uncharacterized protein n=1 Tax=Dreissena polymorpha TaxID=45954 RepID=A0A9D4J052_DREPO|nr:hypothetical protein DPMN_146908 [Dreissena polymorpha]